jgi:hypothetical protein
MNNLSSREKTLAFIVAGIVPVVVLFFGFTYFIGQKNKKSQELTNVTQQLSDIQFREDQAELKRFAQNQFKQRSLASDVSIAKSEYREWLQGLVEKKIGFDGPPKVTYTAAVPYKSDFGQNKELYTKLNFQLDCSGSYKQIVDFLYQFYEKNYLHRITRLDFYIPRGKKSDGKTTADRDRFAVKVLIEVLSLVDADEERKSILVENKKLFYRPMKQDVNCSELEDYYQLVLRRNLFGFPNNAPSFGSRKKEFEFEEGDRISVRLSADDKDEDDLDFTLTSVDQQVASNQIEKSRGGTFRLDIDEIGEYEFKAKVIDKDYYPKSDEMTVVVVIGEKKKVVKKEDPPAPAPKFDPLKFTTLEAIVQNFSGDPLCWIYIRPLDKMYKVGIGEEFEIGRSLGKIISINRRNAVIEVNGDQYRFEVNDFLGSPQDGASVKAVEKPESSPEEPGESSSSSESVPPELSNETIGEEKITEAPAPEEESKADSEEDPVMPPSEPSELEADAKGEEADSKGGKSEDEADPGIELSESEAPPKER